MNRLPLMFNYEPEPRNRFKDAILAFFMLFCVLIVTFGLLRLLVTKPAADRATGEYVKQLAPGIDWSATR